jgi:membrane fusion protein (multidrug efflux system)
MSHQTRAVASFASVGILLTASGCSSTKAAPSVPQPPLVQVAQVIQKEVRLTSEWVATLDGYVNAQIQPHVSGYLIRQNYTEGSLVRKGDVLFEIDPRPFQAALDQADAQVKQAQAQLAQARAQLSKATQDVTRDTPLAEAQAIARSQLDNEIQAQAAAEAAVAAAQAAVAATQAAVEQDKLNLSFTKVTSLVNGIAGIAQGQIGDLVSATTVLVSVSQVDPIKVYFPMSERDYLKAHADGAASQGQSPQPPLQGVPLDLVLADGSTYPLAGHVLWTDRQVDASTGTIRVAAAFPNPGNVLRPGQYGRVRAVTRVEPHALLAPQAAVTELQGHSRVALVGPDNRVTIQAVQIGAQVGGDIIVTEGVKIGDRVVVAGTQFARDGLTVNPAPASEIGKSR